ncbi:MAG: hypothetical protein ACFFD4_10800 [Candidatus Odinarchaeota archaeon]
MSSKKRIGIFSLLITGIAVLLLLNAYVESFPTTTVTEYFINSESPLNSGYIRYKDLSLGGEYFEEVPILILRAEVHSTGLRYLENRALKTTSEIYFNNAGSAISSYSLKAFSENQVIDGSKTILTSRYYLPSPGSYFAGVALATHDAQPVVVNITLTLEYHTSEIADVWWVKRGLDLFYHQGFLNLWLTNPILIGVSVILAIYLDLSLTRYGYKLSQQGYHLFFKQDVYELNPINQEAIHQNKPFGKKSKIVWFLLIILSVYLSWRMRSQPFDDFDTLTTEIVLGLIFLMYLAVILNHISSIRTMQLVRDNPSLLSGEIHIKTPFLYRGSRYYFLVFLVLWTLSFLFLGHTFFIGGIIGALVMLLTLMIWSRRTSSRSKIPSPPVSTRPVRSTAISLQELQEREKSDQGGELHG